MNYLLVEATHVGENALVAGLVIVVFVSEHDWDIKLIDQLLKVLHCETIIKIITLFDIFVFISLLLLSECQRKSSHAGCCLPSFQVFAEDFL